MAGKGEGGGAVREATLTKATAALGAAAVAAKAARGLGRVAAPVVPPLAVGTSAVRPRWLLRRRRVRRARLRPRVPAVRLLPGRLPVLWWWLLWLLLLRRRLRRRL